MRTSTKIATLAFVALLAIGSYFYFTKEEPLKANFTSEKLELAAVKGGCNGASCNGLDPSGRCDDGITVGSKEVPLGLLELRYSRSCKSNWSERSGFRLGLARLELGTLSLKADWAAGVKFQPPANH